MQIKLLPIIRQTINGKVGKIICTLWLAIILLLLAASITFFHSFKYGLFFVWVWVFVSGVLVNIAIILSLIMNRYGIIISKYIWTMLCLIVLVSFFAYSIVDSSVFSSQDFVHVFWLFFVYPLLLLAFPSSFVGLLIAGILTLLVQGIADLIGYEINAFESRTDSYLLLLTVACSGYYQWFILIPSIIERRKRAKNQSEKK